MEFVSIGDADIPQALIEMPIGARVNEYGTAEFVIHSSDPLSVVKAFDPYYFGVWVRRFGRDEITVLNGDHVVIVKDAR